jgi:GT2 family glycosyltransferase
MRFSIIIVNFNGKKYAERCVESILNSSCTNQLEIIVVDNGSTDDSAEYLSNIYQKYNLFHLIKLDKNYGPAFARNIGVINSRGNYIGFLDNDTVVDPKWAETAGKYFDSHSKVGIIQSKLLLLKEPNKIDYVGEFLGQNGFLVQVCPAGTIDTGQFSKSYEILAAKSAGMFIRKKTFEAAGGFDSEYFIYVEETDLGWRSWLMGYKSVFLPTSIVFHEFGTSALVLGRDKNNFNAKFHGTKNYIRTLLKNLNKTNLIKILPQHIFLWLGLSWFSLLRGQSKPFVLIHKAFIWNIKNMQETMKLRNDIQDKRKINDKELFEKVMVGKPLSYFIKKVKIINKIGNAESFTRQK